MATRKTFTYPSGLKHRYTEAELASAKLPNFKLDNALHLSAHAGSQIERDWWALYYVRMASLAPHAAVKDEEAAWELAVNGKQE